jgi:hypothetical protein
LQWKVWKTTSFHDLPQNVNSLNWLEKQKPPKMMWLHTMNNYYTYLHNGLSPSMPVANKALHAFRVHLASNTKNMPSHRLSINSNRQNTQCLALPALYHEA